MPLVTVAVEADAPPGRARAATAATTPVASARVVLFMSTSSPSASTGPRRSARRPGWTRVRARRLEVGEVGNRVLDQGLHRDRVDRVKALLPSLLPIEDLVAEDLDQPGVEMCSGAAAKLRKCVRQGHRRLVRAVGGHRVIGVADEHDAGRERDLVALEPVRVAGTVPALVA